MFASTLPGVEWPTPLTPAERAALKAGVRHTPSLPLWRAYVTDLAEKTNLSPRFAAAVERFAYELAWHGDPVTRTSRGSWEHHGRWVGVSRASVGRYVRTLKDLGLLVVVEPGLSGIPGKVDRQAASYGFTMPLPDEAEDDDEAATPQSKALTADSQTETPTMVPSGEQQTIHARGACGAGAPWSTTQPATTKAECLALVQRLRTESALCRAAGSDRWLRWMLRPALDAGATVADVLNALDRRPDGSRWTHTWDGLSDLRNPAGWLAHRLNGWLSDVAGTFGRRAEARRASTAALKESRAQRIADRAAERAAKIAAQAATKTPEHQALMASIRRANARTNRPTAPKSVASTTETTSTSKTDVTSGPLSDERRYRLAFARTARAEVAERRTAPQPPAPTCAPQDVGEDPVVAAVKATLVAGRSSRPRA